MTFHQLISRTEDSDTVITSFEEESKKRREVLARRPSYRKILNDLSSADISSISSAAAVEYIKSEHEAHQQPQSDPEQRSESTGSSTITVASPYLKVVPSTIQLAPASQDGPIPTLTMSNTNNSGGTIVQYAQTGSDNQFFVPGESSAFYSFNNSSLPCY